MFSFYKNDCKVDNCGQTFANLGHLITHIEKEHLDFSPLKMEQLEREQPECVPPSFILRYSRPNDASPEPILPIQQIESVISDEFNYEANNNYEAWEQGLASPITELHQLFIYDNHLKKPFACNMPGCQKRYKNVNGIKYHYKKHHKLKHVPTFKSSILKYKSETNIRKMSLPARLPSDLKNNIQKKVSFYYTPEGIEPTFPSTSNFYMT